MGISVDVQNIIAFLTHILCKHHESITDLPFPVLDVAKTIPLFFKLLQFFNEQIS